MKITKFAGTIISMLLVFAAALTLQSHDSSAAENAVVNNTAMDLGGAVRAAVTDSGGIAVKADTVSENGKPYYEITVHNDQGTLVLRVDPSTGKVLNKKAMSDTAKEKPLIDKAASDDHSLILSDAIATAEERFGGKATEARIDSDGGRIIYHVKLARGDEDMGPVTVDAGDGSVSRSIYWSIRQLF